MKKRLTDRVTRRHLIGTAAAAVVAAAGIVRSVPDPPGPAAPVPAAPVPDPPVPGPAGASGGVPFDEMYRGRHLQGRPVPEPPGGPAGHDSAGWHVTVDGRRLGLMRRADGSYLSMVDHYESYATPLAATRAAVDELGPLQALSGLGH